jgi:YgiT-type zinc finger domain-containing protein
LINLIRERFRRMEYQYSVHALDQSIQRRISTSEVEEAIEVGEIIESYPSDKYGRSCLIFGCTSTGRPLHIQCTSTGPTSDQSDNLVPAGAESVVRLPIEETAMKCEVCGVGERREELIRYHVDLDGKLVVVEHVPALVCGHCGEISIALQVASSVQRTVWEAKPPVRAIETPVYEFGA